jgi:hypothetical protein
VYKSTDNGATWTYVTKSSVNGCTAANDISLVSIGNKVYLTSADVQTGSKRWACYVLDMTTTLSDPLATPSTFIDSGQTNAASQGTSLVYSPTDNTLHAAWASKNSTYPNSYNIRYAKGTIASDGSVTWGSVTQVTTTNTTSIDNQSPSIVTVNGSPIIVFSAGGSANPTQYIYYARWNGSSFTNSYVYSVASTTLTQSSPSATVDGTGAIHVVWTGYDATDTTIRNIRYSKSTDGGVTWSAMVKLTSGNTYHQDLASITYDQSNNLYVYFIGYGASNTNSYRIKSIVYNGSWGSVTDITTNTTGQGHNMYPSLCDNVRTFTSPLVIWQDNQSPSVKFSGTWTDTPLLSETTSISAVNNKTLIDAIVTKGIGARTQIVSVTSSGVGTSYTYLDGTTGTKFSITVTGLSFKPTFIYAFRNTGTAVDTSTYSELSGDLYAKPVKVALNFNSNTNASATNQHFKGDISPSSVVNGSFTIPVNSANVTYNCLIVG